MAVHPQQTARLDRRDGRGAWHFREESDLTDQASRTSGSEGALGPGQHPEGEEHPEGSGDQSRRQVRWRQTTARDLDDRARPADDLHAQGDAPYSTESRA